MAYAKYCCFVALEEELKYIYEIMNELEYTALGDFRPGVFEHDFEKLEKNELTGENLIISITFFLNDEMGNVGSAVNAIRGIELSAPHAAFIIGIAGTLDKDKAKLGDVIVSSCAKRLLPDKFFEVETAVIDSVSKAKRVGDRSLLRYRREYIEFEPTTKLLGRYLRVKERVPVSNLRPIDNFILGEGEYLAELLNDTPKIKFGSILSTDWVVDSEEFVNFALARDISPADDWYEKGDPLEAKKRNSWCYDRPVAILCVDMESYGFFRAIRASNKAMHAISIRGVSDPCMNKKNIDVDAKELRRIATHNALYIFIDLVNFMTKQDIARRPFF